MRTFWRALLPFLLTATALVVAPQPAHAVATRVMVVGDSISQGSAGDFTWRYRLAKKLAVTAPGAVDLVGPRTDLYDNVTGQQGSQAYRDASFDRQHEAIWGRRLSDEKTVIASRVSAATPDVLLVLLGINDLEFQGSTPAQVAQDMREFIGNARSARPGVDVVIGHTLSRYDLWAGVPQSVANTADLNARLDALAAELNTSSSRVLTAATDAGWNASVHTWDGTHPDATGEVRIAAAFTDALSTLGVGSPYGTRPSFVQWTSAGAKPTVTPQTNAAMLTWAASPGATGYLIEQKVISAGETVFTRLPYPVSGTSWTAQLLAPGPVEFRVVPTKGRMTGLPGPSTTATVLG